VSGPSQVKDVPIDDRSQLVEFLASGSKPPEQWRIGTEHEKFGFRLDDLRPLPWDGARHRSAAARPDPLRLGAGRGERQADRAEPRTGLGHAGTGGSAGTFRRAAGNHPRHLLRRCLPPARGEDGGRRTGLGFLGMGFQPKWRREEMPWMPKGRYQIMRDYMPKRGNLGLDMMTRTCTVQVNLDFASEADMVKKFRVSLALQPVATALFADSPFTDGKPNGYQSYRSHIWTDTDPDRTGHAGLRVRGRLRLRALRRLPARRADVFRLPRRRYIDASGKLPRFPRGRAAGAAGPSPTLKRLGRPHDHRLPRSAAEESTWRCAAPMAAPGTASARCRRSGSACSTTMPRWMPPGIWSRISRWRNATRCATACRRMR
jgi:glutamate--cysteine ligase